MRPSTADSIARLLVAGAAHLAENGNPALAAADLAVAKEGLAADLGPHYGVLEAALRYEPHGEVPA